MTSNINDGFFGVIDKLNENEKNDNKDENDSPFQLEVETQHVEHFGKQMVYKRVIVTIFRCSFLFFCLCFFFSFFLFFFF